MRVPSLNNQTRQVAQEFDDQEIQEFLDANSSYDGPSVEEAKAAGDEKGYRAWYSKHVRALAELMFRELTNSNGEKAMVQILRVETEEWVQWQLQESKKRKSQH